MIVSQKTLRSSFAALAGGFVHSDDSKPVLFRGQGNNRLVFVAHRVGEGGFDKSVITTPPFLCWSAQSEEGKNRHDDHDETDKVYNAVHYCLFKIDRYGIGMRGALKPSSRCRRG
jgi:hypothetical protein